MKKTVMVLLAVAVVVSMVGFIAGCSGCNSCAKTLKNGTYYSQGDDFSASGWKGFVSVVVDGGKIVSAKWDAVSLDYNLTKRELSEKGLYDPKQVMTAPWHVQADAVEAYLISTQNANFAEYKDEEGHTDAITGASISVKEYFELVQKAIASGAVKTVKSSVDRIVYLDGNHKSEEEGFDAQGWKDYVYVYVKNGSIVSVHWNAVHMQGANKRDAVKAGTYKMPEGEATWTEQANAVSRFIIANPDLSKAPAFDAEGKTTAIAGATMAVKDCFDQVAAALKGQKVE